MIRTLPPEVEEFVVFLSRVTEAPPMMLVYGHGVLPAPEENPAAMGAYCPEKHTAIVWGADFDGWQDYLLEDGSPAFASRDELVNQVLETVAHEYGHHLHYAQTGATEIESEIAEPYAEKFARDMMARWKACSGPPKAEKEKEGEKEKEL